MASYQLDQRGGHYDDLRAGAIASVIGNVHRDRKRHPEPFSELDFTPWNEYSRERRAAEPILLDDADAQSDLISRTMFPPRT